MSKKNSLIDQWKVMEQIKKDGLAKSIGVSNFREEDLQAIQDKWEIPPAVNQVGIKEGRAGDRFAPKRSAHSVTVIAAAEDAVCFVCREQCTRLLALPLFTSAGSVNMPLDLQRHPTGSL